MIFDITNKTKYKFNKKLLENITKTTLKKCNVKFKKAEIGLTFLSQAEIARINKKYRNKDKPTDVLSFSYVESNNKKFIILSGGVSLGEIFIAPDVVKKNAKKYEVSFKYEMTRVLVHGILHLLGYEHEGNVNNRKVMESIEDEILDKLYI